MSGSGLDNLRTWRGGGIKRYSASFSLSSVAAVGAMLSSSLILRISTKSSQSERKGSSSSAQTSVLSMISVMLETMLSAGELSLDSLLDGAGEGEGEGERVVLLVSDTGNST